MTDLTQTLSTLFATFPPLQGAATPEGALAAMQAYVLAVGKYDMQDIEEGVRRLVAGEIGEHDGRYPPTAPQLARAVHKARDARLDRERDRRPRLPPRDIEKSPESQERVRALTEQAVHRLAGVMRTDDAAAAKRRQELQERTDERFAPDPSPSATASRLGFRYSAGDPDGEAG